MDHVSASIVVVSRNRADELRRALVSCLGQTGVRCEILVYDDASSDGTNQMVASEFPDVRYLRSQERLGYIALRNLGFREAQGKYVFSIDDDAYFSSPETVAMVVDYLEQHPSCAAAAIRYVEPFPEGRRVSSCTLRHGTPVRSYVGTAYAMRPEVALSLGGYKESLVHQGEERDLCIRMLDADYAIDYVDAPPIVHCVSPKRDLDRMHRYSSRNQILFDCCHTPRAYLGPILAKHTASMLTYRLSVRRFLRTLPLVVQGLAAGMRHRRLGRAVSVKTFRTYYQLPSHGPVYTSVEDMPEPCRPRRRGACSAG